MIVPGKYLAKIADYSIIENDSGELVVVIRFEFDGGKNWAWTGGFGSDKARERTLKTLMTCGLKSDELDLLCDGPSSGALDTESEVEIVLEESEYNGKKRLQISYVNPVGGRSFGAAITKDKARPKLGGMNLKGELAALGFKKKTTEDMPF